MSAFKQHESYDQNAVMEIRELADQAFSRATGAPLIEGNQVRLLKDAHENYSAWLDAIHSAKSYIHFESYIIYEDIAGREFADALIEKAKQGVRVSLMYDWLGALRKTSRRFWNRLRQANINVRCFNPPRLDSPLGWFSRDHRKMLVIDGQIGFITGLCIGRKWQGIPEKKIDPWRDTGVEVRGPAVADIDRSFAHVWAMTGDPLPYQEIINTEIPRAGEMNVRVVATTPATAGMFRLDQLVTALARKRVWLTDAYYLGTTSYVQALRAAAQDGVEVCMLVPSGTDIPILKLLSRSGYRTLLEAGVRVFEWNGTMLHAKSAVIDGRWARVGSTNLNIASWLGNCELDLVIENEEFAAAMEQMYIQDLKNATEIVLHGKRKTRAVKKRGSRTRPFTASGSGRVGRAAAGALRIGHTVGAAFTGRRVLEPVEARLMTIAGLILLAISILFAFFPQGLAYPLLLIFAWLGFALLYQSLKLYREGKNSDQGKRRKRKSKT